MIDIQIFTTSKHPKNSAPFFISNWSTQNQKKR